MKKLCLLTILFSLTAIAQDGKPNFSGVWELQVANSDFGPLPAPESQTSVVDHQEPQLKLNTTARTVQGELTAAYVYTTDGQENTNEVRGSTRKSRTRWESKELVTEAEFEAQGLKIRLKDRWRLSEDGQTWTSDRTLNSDMGEAVQKLIFAKKK